MDLGKGELFLALDVGSSGIKAVVFDAGGTQLLTEHQTYPYHRATGTFYELDLEVLWGSIWETIRRITARLSASAIIGVGVSAQLGIVAIDRRGVPLRPAITWMDRRAGPQAQHIRSVLRDESIYRVSGRRITPELAVAKILWVKEHEPEIYARTHLFLSLKDYIVLRLGGCVFTDASHASYTMLFNVTRRGWEEDFSRELGIDGGKLPEVMPAEGIVGHITREASRQTGLTEGTAVILGGPDGTVGTLGAGLVSSGDSVNVIGTSDVFFTCLSEPALDAGRRTVLNCHLVPGLWLAGGPMSTTGGCLKWFMEQFGLPESAQATDGESAFELFDRMAAGIAPGSGKLVCIPSLVGERAPIWDPNVRGVFLGLSPEHTKAHIYRSILEGSAYALRQMLDTLEEAGIQIGDIRATGGGAKSSLWCQVRADAAERRIVLPAVGEATTLGTAVLAAVGTGIYPDWDTACRQMVRVVGHVDPLSENVPIYKPYIGIFKRLYRDLFEDFSALAGIA